MKRKYLLLFSVLICMLGTGCSSGADQNKGVIAISVIEAYPNIEVIGGLIKADSCLTAHPAKVDSLLGINSIHNTGNPLLTCLRLMLPTSRYGGEVVIDQIITFVGSCEEKDTASINALLSAPEVQAFLPRRSKRYWTAETDLYSHTTDNETQTGYEEHTIYYLSIIKPKPLPVKLGEEDIRTIQVRKRRSPGMLYDLYQRLSTGMSMSLYDVTIELNDKGIRKVSDLTTDLGYFVVDIRLGEVRYALSLTNVQIGKSMTVTNRVSPKELDYLKDNYSDMIDSDL